MRVPYIELDPLVRYMTEEERLLIVEAVKGDGMVDIADARLEQLQRQASMREMRMRTLFAVFQDKES